jgi:hypothetical protein
MLPAGLNIENPLSDGHIEYRQRKVAQESRDAHPFAG